MPRCTNRFRHQRGTATQGQTLTASNTLADADGLTIYQWKRDINNISGATSATYTLFKPTPDHQSASQPLHRRARNSETVNSSYTSAVANVNDAPIGSVTISGTATQGETLTVANTLADADGLGPVGYQWKRGGEAITGETSANYTLVQADVGSAITVTASYEDGQGTAESMTSNATAAVANVNDVPTGSILIDGSTTEGQTLTAITMINDPDGIGTLSYQWKRGDVGITGATSSTYELVLADVGSSISVAVSYTDDEGNVESVTSSITPPVADKSNNIPTGSVTISGTANQGQTLTAGNTLADADGIGIISYRWMRAAIPISGATSTTYELVQADVGSPISVTASYTDGKGTAETVVSDATSVVANVNDAPTGSVTISGTPTQGQTLTAVNTLADADGLGTMSYSWKRAGSSISGAAL